MEPTERVAFVAHHGARILAVDYHGLRAPADLARLADEATRRIHGEPRGAVLVLADLTDVPHTLRTVRHLGELAVANAPYVRARALLGLPESAWAVMRAVALLSGKPLEAFADRGSALDWLAEQAG